MLHVTYRDRVLQGMNERKKMTVRERVAAYRARLREEGLRPVQVWVPDTRSREFQAEAHRQSAMVGHSPAAAEDQAFIDGISELDEA